MGFRKRFGKIIQIWKHASGSRPQGLEQGLGKGNYGSQHSSGFGKELLVLSTLKAGPNGPFSDLRFEGLAVKVNPRSQTDRFGLIVRIGVYMRV